MDNVNLVDDSHSAQSAGAEHNLLDQHVFMVSDQQYQALLDMLEQPESNNAGLQVLFARAAPWFEK